MQSRPRVIAHRGASEAEPEHTPLAYRRALDDGADGVECDVRLTRDGVLVCVHDRRIDRTSSGRGVVSTLELADLSELDFGSWHRAAGDAEEPDRDRTGVLTLARLLELVRDSGRPVEVAIETKHPTRYAGLVELGVVELLGQHRLLSPQHDDSVKVRVMSFSATSLRRIRALAPGLPTVLLRDRLALRGRDGTLPAGAVASGPSLRLLRANPALVQRVHDAGNEVHVWTVDELADVDYVVGLGVDVIITNRPRAVLDHLGG